jgi:hypothetical protein
VQVPGHATYPAGHALIGHLTSACLEELLPIYKEPLRFLADRCGMNRVIAGLHFRQDIEVGAQCGRQVHTFLKECALYKKTIAAAREEWA